VSLVNQQAEIIGQGVIKKAGNGARSKSMLLQQAEAKPKEQTAYVHT